MKRSLLAWGLLVVGLGSVLGCGVTLQELRERNPNAKTLQVPCRPAKIPDWVILFSMRASGEHIVTDETPSALRDSAARLTAGQDLWRGRIESARGDFHAIELKARPLN